MPGYAAGPASRALELLVVLGFSAEYAARVYAAPEEPWSRRSWLAWRLCSARPGRLRPS